MRQTEQIRELDKSFFESEKYRRILLRARQSRRAGIRGPENRAGDARHAQAA